MSDSTIASSGRYKKQKKKLVRHCINVVKLIKLLSFEKRSKTGRF
jgi:hypothetical protein